MMSRMPSGLRTRSLTLLPIIPPPGKAELSGGTDGDNPREVNPNMHAASMQVDGSYEIPVADAVPALVPPDPPASTHRRPRFFCPVPGCPEGVQGMCPGWKDEGGMRQHLSEHCGNESRLLGDIPNVFLDDNLSLTHI